MTRAVARRMRPGRLHEPGAPAEVMRLEEVARPTPGEGQLVRVRAAALDLPDVLMAQGRYQERPPLS